MAASSYNYQAEPSVNRPRELTRRSSLYSLLYVECSGTDDGRRSTDVEHVDPIEQASGRLRRRQVLS